MKRLIAIILVLPCLVVLRCGPVQQTKSDSSHYIDFGNLLVGQSNRYVSFTIVNDTMKIYGKDTAVVEIMDTLAGGYIFRASFSPGSQSYVAGTPAPQYRVQILHDSTYQTAQLAGNNVYLTLLIPPLNFPVSYEPEGAFAFKRVSPTFCDTVITQSHNQRTFYGTATGCATSHFDFGTQNIVIDYSARLTTGLGNACVFSRSMGFVYIMSFSCYSTSRSAIGWEFIP